MMNWRLINEAVKMVNDYFDYEGIYESNKTIIARASDWYSKTEITDSEMLAAAVISGPYQRYSWTELEKLKEFYFPSCPLDFDNFGIGEIEAAMKDAAWR